MRGDDQIFLLTARSSSTHILGCPSDRIIPVVCCFAAADISVLVHGPSGSFGHNNADWCQADAVVKGIGRRVFVQLQDWITRNIDTTSQGPRPSTGTVPDRACFRFSSWSEISVRLCILSKSDVRDVAVRTGVCPSSTVCIKTSSLRPIIRAFFNPLLPGIWINHDARMHNQSGCSTRLSSFNPGISVILLRYLRNRRLERTEE